MISPGTRITLKPCAGYEHIIEHGIVLHKWRTLPGYWTVRIDGDDHNSIVEERWLKLEEPTNED